MTIAGMLLATALVTVIDHAPSRLVAAALAVFVTAAMARDLWLLWQR